nr:putative wall-associated receptor kinase-like 16 [Ziziphus jujuba var. spinosa]
MASKAHSGLRDSSPFKRYYNWKFDRSFNQVFGSPKELLDRGIVQWDFIRRDHPGDPGRVSGVGPVTEYMHTSHLTEKSDVYSFGVVLAELLTGRKVMSFDRLENERNLALFFVSSMKEDRLLEILDNDIIIEENTEAFKNITNLAKRCLRIKSEERPSMKEVALELKGQRAMAM